MHKCRGQTILEYTVILIIILGVLVAMKDYVKRGIQGRWKSSADDIGDQYDPQSVNANITYATTVNSQSVVTAENGTSTTGGNGTTIDGFWTNRVDYSNSVETKTGYSQVGN
jgi:Flp pilus assembly pilin Flp